MNTLKSLLLVGGLASGAALAAEPLQPQASIPVEASMDTRIDIALALRTPSCKDSLVSSLPSGNYVGQNSVIAYPTAAEASDSESWSYELRVMDTILRLAKAGHVFDLDSAAYRAIDAKSVDRFMEPGTSFVLTDEHQLHARRATVNSRSVWLADNLPGACFGFTVPEEAAESAQKICFVPLAIGTAASQ